MSETENTTQITFAAAPAPVLTPREKLIAKYNKLFAKRKEIDEELTAIVGEVSAIDALGSIGVGTKVIISVGKGEAAKDVLAEVIAVRDEDGGKSLKVAYGTGFDADVAVVKASKVRLPAAGPVDQATAAE